MLKYQPTSKQKNLEQVKNSHKSGAQPEKIFNEENYEHEVMEKIKACHISHTEYQMHGKCEAHLKVQSMQMNVGVWGMLPRK